MIDIRALRRIAKNRMDPFAKKALVDCGVPKNILPMIKAITVWPTTVDIVDALSFQSR